jgi:hypothetical protein
MFRRIKAVLYRCIIQYLTIRVVVGVIVVYCLLKTLEHGVVRYKNLERFYVKVSVLCNQPLHLTMSVILLFIC